MIKKIILSLCIQSIGTLASFVTVWIISNRYGLSAQGEFALIKSWVDMLVVVGCFGFPQSIIYIINKYNIQSSTLTKYALLYILLLLFPFAIATYYWAQFYFQLKANALFLLLLTASSSLLVGHGLLRSVYLTQEDGNRFAIISILPATLLLIGLLLPIWGDSPVVGSYVVSSLLSIAIVLLFLKQTNTYTHGEIITNTVFPWNDLILKGFNSFLQAFSLIILPIITYVYLSKVGASQSEIGGFNIASYFYTIFAIPFSMIAPILFNRWSKLQSTKLIKNEVIKILVYSVVFLPFCFIFSYCIPYLVNILFYKSSENLDYIIVPAEIIIYSAYPLLVVRVLGNYFLSIGDFFINSMGYGFKTLFCFLLMFLCHQFNFLDLRVMAFIWMISEIMLAIILFIKFRMSR